MNRFLLVQFIVLAYTYLCIIRGCESTLSKTKSSKKKPPEREMVKSSQPNLKSSISSVVDRGLVVPTPTLTSLLEESSLYCRECRFNKNTPGQVLGYVTPWNNHGYDVAKTFGAKFTMISPVWLQLVVSENGEYSVLGTHDVDMGWMKDVQLSNNDIKIVPRLLFDKWSGDDYKRLFGSEDEIREVCEVILSTLKHYKFSGIVLEIWSQLGPYFRSELLHFLQHLSHSLHDNGQIIILVIPPPIGKIAGIRAMFEQSDFNHLKKLIDGFSLMTYDYSSAKSPGATSPLDWIEECVSYLSPTISDPYRSKILLGINFYGYEYDRLDGAAGHMQPVVGNRFLEIVRDLKPKIKWDGAVHEAYFTYKSDGKKYTLLFPTLQSIKDRIDLASQLNTGISIWEIGQGLDYFYDLL